MKLPLFAVMLLASMFLSPLVPMHESHLAHAAPKSTKTGENSTTFTLASRFPGGEGAMNKAAWKTFVPAIQEVTLPSTADGTSQPAMWLDSGSTAEKPLLVVLHSWSTDYRQNISIPYALFAARNDWLFIHPNFRGPNQKPSAGASDLVTSDILDAIAFAKRHAKVDTSRIYLAGFSGGGLAALAMAGRRPDIWAGVLAWCPIHDIVDWYKENLEQIPRRHYVGNIEAVCGGAPRKGSTAENECRKRSPSAVLERAKKAGVPIYIAAGIRDTIVRPRHAIAAFNQLVGAADQLTGDLFAQLSPVRVSARNSIESPDPYTRAGAPARLVRTSGNTTLVLFDGGHDVVYDAGLSWLKDRRRALQDSK